MKTYILVLYDGDRQVIGVRALAATSEDAALTEAHAVARGGHVRSSYELWIAGRKVAAFFAKRSPDTSVEENRQI